MGKHLALIGGGHAHMMILDNLKTIVEVIKSRQLGDGEFCRMKHDVIDRKFSEHDKRLDSDEKDIAVIQEKIKKL